MDIHLQRRIDKYLGTLICFLLTLIHRIWRLVTSPAPPGPPQRILVILLSEMGSLVLAHPMVEKIKATYPEAELHLVQFKKNSELSRLLGLVPDEHIWTIDDRSIFRFAWDTLALLVRLRMKRIDTVIDCELFARVSAIISFFSGAAVRVGFHPYTQEGLYRGGFINRPVPYNPYRHMSQQFIALVDAIDSSAMPVSKSTAPAQELRVPHVPVARQALQRMHMRLETDFGLTGSPCPDILIYPGGGILPIRAWPPGHYRELCHRLVDDGYTIGIIGMAEDKALAATIMQSLPADRCIDLTGYTRNLYELLVLLNQARLLITNDGGPGQFAALTSIDTMIFFGPETPVLYGPMNHAATIFFSQASCSPCLTAYNHRCSPCDGDNQCLTSIDVDTVHRKALTLLERRQRVVNA